MIYNADKEHKEETEMASMKSIREAIKRIDIDDLTDAYGFIGIRVQEETYGLTVGDTVAHNSKVWVDGDETDEELDGVSAMNINALDAVQGYYFGACVLILGSNYAGYGEDAGEIIMRDAKVLAIIDVNN